MLKKVVATKDLHAVGGVAHCSYTLKAVTSHDGMGS